LYLKLSKQNTTEKFINDSNKKIMHYKDLEAFNFYILQLVNLKKSMKNVPDSEMLNNTYWLGLQKYMEDALKINLKLKLIEFGIKLSNKELKAKVDEFTSLFYNGEKNKAMEVIGKIFEDHLKKSTSVEPVKTKRIRQEKCIKWDKEKLNCVEGSVEWVVKNATPTSALISEKQENDEKENDEQENDEQENDEYQPDF